MNQDDRSLWGLLQVLQVPIEIERDGLLVVIPVGDGRNPDVGDDGIVIGYEVESVSYSYTVLSCFANDDVHTPSRVADVNLLLVRRELVKLGEKQRGQVVGSGT